MKHRRLVAAVAAVAALAVTAPPVPAGADGTPSPPDSFSVTASAAPIDSLSAVPTALALQAETGIAVSSLKLNGQPFITASASPLYVPALAALQGGDQVAALASCTANFPGDPHEASCGGPGQSSGGLDVGAASGHALAQANADDPSATRGEAAAHVAGAGLGVASSGSVASAVSGYLDGGRLVGGASSALDDVLIAGVLRIGSIRSDISGALGGEPGTGALTTSFDVAGASIGGIPVDIDEQGVHVQDTGLLAGALDQLQAAVNGLLAQAGLSIDVVPARTEDLPDDGTTLSAASGGLAINFDQPTSGVFVHLLLARSTLSMSAVRFAPATAASPVAAATTPTSSAVGPTTAVRPMTAPAAPPPAPVAGVGAPALAVPAAVGVPFEDADWQVVYLVSIALVMALPLLTILRRTSWSAMTREALRG